VNTQDTKWKYGMQAAFTLMQKMVDGFRTYCYALQGLTYVDGSTFVLPADIPRAGEITNTHHCCIKFCRFGMCNKNNPTNAAADRTELETLEWVKIYNEEQVEARKKKLKKDLGILPSGFYYRPELPELKMHKDCPNEILHNVKLGAIKTSVKNLYETSNKEELTKLKKAIKGYDYSGFEAKLTSNLDKHSRFKGREFWLLVQILPLILRNLKSQRNTTHFWVLLAEGFSLFHLLSSLFISVYLAFRS